MRRSLLPASVPAPIVVANDAAAAPVSKLARARNSLVPQRQPLAPVQTNVAAAPAPAPLQLGLKRSSAAFSQPASFTIAVDEPQPRPVKLARTSLAPRVPAPAPAVAAPAPTPAVRSSAASSSSMPHPSPATVASGGTELSVNCVPGYNAEMLKGPNGTLYSFEEVRAMQPRYARKKTTAATMAAAPAALTISTASTSVHRNSTATTPSSAGHRRGGSSGAGVHFTPDDNPHSASHNHSLSHPSPTMCTRAAMNDIEAMFKDQSPAAASCNAMTPFSARSLTNEIPPMAAQTFANASSSSRGRPSPVAFAVFTDEEMQTRNIALACAASQIGQMNRAKGVGMTVFVDPDLENVKPAGAAAVATPAQNNNAGGARRQALRAVLSVAADEDEEEDDENDENAYSGSNGNNKSYPPLTPIAEVNESDMSHASSTGGATPGLTVTAQASARATAQALALQQQRLHEEEEAEAEAAAAAAAANATPAAGAAEVSDGVLDPFDPSVRIEWINELGLLGSANVVDLTSSSTPTPWTLSDLANQQLEIGEHLFQVLSVQETNGDSGSVVAEDLLDGGEVLLRLGGVANLFEMHVGSSLLAKLLECSGGGGGDSEGSGNEGLIRSLFLLPSKAIVYPEGCCVVSPVTPGPCGTLQRVLGAYGSSGSSKVMDERLVAYYAHELLKLLQILHVNGFIHADLTLANIWVRYGDELPSEPWSDTWQSEGEEGWGAKGLALANLGSMINKNLFAEGTLFRRGAGTSVSEETDLRAFLQVLYEMLFGLGSKMDVVRDTEGSLTVAMRGPGAASGSPMMQTVFKPVFDTVLNTPFDPSNPQATADLVATLLTHFKQALDMELDNGQQPHGKSIKGLLQQQQLMMLQKKK